MNTMSSGGKAKAERYGENEHLAGSRPNASEKTRHHGVHSNLLLQALPEACAEGGDNERNERGVSFSKPGLDLNSSPYPNAPPLISATVVNSSPDAPIQGELLPASPPLKSNRKKLMMAGTALIILVIIIMVVVVVFVGSDSSPSAEDLAPPTVSPAPTSFLQLDNIVWEQVGEDLYGGDPTYFQYYNWKLDLSSDGTTLAVGANMRNETHRDMGEVRVYGLVDNGWKQLGQNLLGITPGSAFASSIALSGSGRFLAIGEKFNSDVADKAGKVHVYIYDSDTSLWKLSVKQATGDEDRLEGEQEGDNYGTSVSFSESGRRLVVGASQIGFGTGYVKAYEYWESDVWQAIDRGILGVLAGDAFGSSVSLTADGKFVAIGAVHADTKYGNDTGLVKVYSSKGLSNGFLQAISNSIIGDKPFDGLGATSISADGRCVAVGASQESAPGSQPGYARVFCRVGASWSQIGHDLLGIGPGDAFGSSMSISANGRTLVVSARKNDANGEDSGAVEVFQFDNNDWVPVGGARGDSAGDNFGMGQAASADGNMFAAGASFEEGKRAYVRVFKAVAK